jgi:hypothetical protein
MGTNNRARRAAKARRRSKQAFRAHQQHHSRRSPPLDDDPDDHARRAAPGGWWDDFEHDLHRMIGAIWSCGWQPVELVREVRRSAKRPGTVELARHLIAVDHARRDPSTLHSMWRAQIDSLDLPQVGPAAGWLDEAIGDGSSPRVIDLRLLLTTLSGLGVLQRLIPPPGGSADDVDLPHAGNDGEGSDPVLERVRALLAQAESTSYPAEAEAFTAKAHELMTRHAIDVTMVEGTASGWITAVRIPIDDPYVDAKSLLLHCVAENSRCRAVFHGRYAMSTLIGARGDLAAVQLLFTSLLLQAQQALLAEGDAVAVGARQRSRSYRASFLAAFAHRVAVDEVFGTLTRSRGHLGSDPAGWASGRSAADRARLGDPDLDRGSGGQLSLSPFS